MNKIKDKLSEFKNKKIIKDILDFFHKNKKKSRLFFYTFFLFFIYIFLFSQARDLEMRSTFPWSFIKFENKFSSLDLWFEFEEINIYKENWDLLNGLYLWTWTWKTVYYFHWNGWPNPYFYSDIKYINDLWYNVMMYDYPWYWKSTWLPYKENIDDSSQLFFNYLQNEKNIESSDLILFGYSVWTAVAVDFASKNDFDKLILISPFSSRHDMSKSMLWFAAQKLLLLKDSYITRELVKNFENDVLIIHWNKDEVIPFEHWLKVFENYLWNKNFIELDNFWHNWVIYEYSDTLKNIFVNFISWDNLNFENNYLFLDNEKIEEIKENNIKLEEEIQKKEQERKKQEFLNSLDLYSDNSLHKFVNSSISFNNKWYIPKNLVSVSWKYVYDPRWWSQTVTLETRNALYEMWEAFYNHFKKPITVISAYRSYAYQQWIKDRWCPDNLCAKAGYSEHQSWLAVDFWEASTETSWKNNRTLTSYFNWLKENAHKYWFHNTYQRWLKIDWYDIEPWHWRYLWVEFATYLKENNLTIAEFYFFNSK